MTTKESTISAEDAQSRFDEMVRRARDHEAIIVEQSGEPQVAIISVEEYRRLGGNDPETLAVQETGDNPEWLRMVEETGKLFEKDLKGEKIDVDEIIHRMRDERDEELLEGLR